MDGIMPNLNARKAHRGTRRLNFWFHPLCVLLKKHFTLHLSCDHCDKFIPSDANWLCSYCDNHNEDTDTYSFVNECRRCSRSPKAYICYHCGDVNYLDETKNSRHAAKLINGMLESPPVDIVDVKHQAHLERKAELEREIEITRLAAQLEELKSSPIFKKEVAAKEKLLESFSRFEAHNLGVHMFAHQKRKEYADKFKDEPDFLEQANEALAGFVEQELTHI